MPRCTTWIALLAAGCLPLAGCGQDEDSAANAEPVTVASKTGGEASVPVMPREPQQEPLPEISAYDKPGFVTRVVDGRLWVFRTGSEALEEFRETGEPAKHVTMPLAGPGRITVKGPDSETILAYLSTRPGFETRMEDGRMWVFYDDSEALAQFEARGEPAKHVTLPLAGPGDVTLKAPDMETVQAYGLSKPGFVTRVVDGRLWVFHAASEALAEFRETGEPAKHVTLPLAGPGGMTIKAVDTETVEAYMVAQPGFVTELKDGRIWVFRPATEALAEFREHGEPAKHVTLPLAGPMDKTVKAPDMETAEAYLAMYKE